MGKTYQSILIKAPAEKVWETLRNFHDISWAPDVVSSVDVIGDKKGDQPGAKRVLNGAFHETLHALDDDNREFTYWNGKGQEAEEFCHGIYAGLLGQLKKALE